MANKSRKEYKQVWIETFIEENGQITAYVELPNREGVVSMHAYNTAEEAITAARLWIDLQKA